MLGPFDYALWVLSFLAEAYVVVCAVKRGTFLRYASLNIYMIAAALVSVGEFLVLRQHGFSSREYYFYYYYSDCLLTVLLFFVVRGLYAHVFKEMRADRYLRIGAALLLAATALFSYLVVRENKDHLTGRFVVELGQNLYFVGVVLTYLLWAAVLKLRETRTRLIQLVLALGVYFSGTAATFAIRNMFGNVHFVSVIQPLLGTWLPLAWAYTFTRVSEDARLATARLVAKAAR
jgi:hypothetical protein